MLFFMINLHDLSIYAHFKKKWISRREKYEYLIFFYIHYWKVNRYRNAAASYSNIELFIQILMKISPKTTPTRIRFNNKNVFQLDFSIGNTVLILVQP